MKEVGQSRRVKGVLGNLKVAKIPFPPKSEFPPTGINGRGPFPQ